MAEAKKKTRLVTPRGEAIYPNINRPDKKYPKNGYPVYGSRLRIKPDADGLDAFVKKCETLRDELVESTIAELKAKKEGAKAKSLKVVPVLKAEVDKETGEETGNQILNAKLTSGGKRQDGTEFTQKPDIVDSKGNPLKNPPIIYGGSTLKLGVEPFAYYSAKDNEVGVSFRLKAAQIIKLAAKRDNFEWGANDEDGYVHDESDDAPASDFGDESGGASDSAPPKGENPDF